MIIIILLSYFYLHSQTSLNIKINQFDYVFESSAFTIPKLFIQLYSYKILSKPKIITLNPENPLVLSL